MHYEIVADEKAGVRVVLNKARLGSDAPLGDTPRGARTLSALARFGCPRRLDALPDLSLRLALQGPLRQAAAGQAVGHRAVRRRHLA